MNSDTIEILGRAIQYIGWVFLPFLILPFLILLFSKTKFLINFQYNLIAIIDSFTMKIGEWVKWLLLILVISVVVSVVALSIFGLSWTKLDEGAIYLHALVIFLGSAAALLAGEHVRVDIFYAKMRTKNKALVDFIGFYALLMPFCLIIIWGSQKYVGLVWGSFEGSAESDGIRGVFLLKTMVPVLAAMMLAQGFAIAGRAALLLSGQNSPPLPKNISPVFGEHDPLEGGL